MIYITSDTHFGHDKDFLYAPRGFSSIEEHDAAIIEKWNSIVKPDDTVYHLGDVMLGNNESGIQKLEKLNGHFYIILGNHDTSARQELYLMARNVDGIEFGQPIKYKKFRFFLSHYPTLCSNADDGENLREHVINLCGHSHTQDRFKDWGTNLIYHCELDAHDCAPVSLDQIIEDCRGRFYETLNTQ